jgi:hypothetical protein
LLRLVLLSHCRASYWSRSTTKFSFSVYFSHLPSSVDSRPPIPRVGGFLLGMDYFMRKEIYKTIGYKKRKDASAESGAADKAEKSRIDQLKFICDRNKEVLKYVYEDMKFLDAKYTRFFVLTNALIAVLASAIWKITSGVKKFAPLEDVLCMQVLVGAEVLICAVAACLLIWVWVLLLNGIDSVERLSISTTKDATLEDILETDSDLIMTRFASDTAEVIESIYSKIQKPQKTLKKAHTVFTVSVAMVIVCYILLISLFVVGADRMSQQQDAQRKAASAAQQAASLTAAKQALILKMGASRGTHLSLDSYMGASIPVKVKAGS